MRWRATRCVSSPECRPRRCRRQANTRHARSWRPSSEAFTRRWAADLPTAFAAAAEHVADELGAQRLEEGLESAAVHESTEPARLFRGFGCVLPRRRLLGWSLCSFGFDLLVRGFPVLGFTVDRLQRAGFGRCADRVIADGRHQ